MATEDAYLDHIGVPADPPLPADAGRRRTILDRRRERSARRKQARLMSALDLPGFDGESLVVE